MVASFDFFYSTHPPQTTKKPVLPAVTVRIIIIGFSSLIANRHGLLIATLSNCPEDSLASTCV
jgi:hypothetical protein